ncbi:nucleotidyltransferase domain-containing protein [Ruania zhangjianzhongii]|uniref:nucleotidyltransferase domain-containing protein n=1 Tax=Ruania zhangjianzhongii TaxID=2603206 RepID=UPI0011C7A416|nr:hypothetical protein [Ruania zhangjianzhongii]
MRYDPARHHWRPLTVDAVIALLGSSSTRWWLSGGCGLDHWLGRTTREHGDIDVSVIREDWRRLVAELPTRLELLAAMSGALLPLAECADDPALHNIWVRSAETGEFVLQINIEDGDQHLWRYRRLPAITRAWAHAVESVRGVPTVNPAVQLLWKSARPVDKDDEDRAAILPVLTRTDRRWLTDAIERAHPQSPWLSGRENLAD